MPLTAEQLPYSMSTTGYADAVFIALGQVHEMR